MFTLSLQARVLGARLGLGDLHRGEICFGYANCCECSECMERESQPAPEPVRQPWELAA